MNAYDPTRPPPKPPQKLWKADIADILAWYEANLCTRHLVDPRGKRIVFSTDRFPHFIKLMHATSGKEVKNPQEVVKRIKSGTATNADFGGYEVERAQTLPWLPMLIQEPSLILEVVQNTVWERTGDTLIVKEFEKKGYRHKILVCRTVGNGVLVPVTSHPKNKGKFGKEYEQVWP